MENIAKSECGRVHGPNWLKWTGHLKNKPGVIGLEVGTFKGDSAQWFLDNIFTNATSQYVCVDTFEGSIEHKIGGIDCSENEKITREKLSSYDNVTIHREYSNKFMGVTEMMFDFIYVDAAHDSMNVMRDAVLGFEILKPGGVMVFDDYTWNVMPRPIDCPRMGVDAFVSCYAEHLRVLGRGYQFAIQKLNNK